MEWNELRAVYLADHTAVMACHCERCGHRLLIRPELIEAMMELERRLGFNLRPTNAYRCPDHNLEVGGYPLSRHIDGLAVDVEEPDAICKGMTVTEFVRNAHAAGFGGVKYYPAKNIFHLQVPEVRR